MRQTENRDTLLHIVQKSVVELTFVEALWKLNSKQYLCFQPFVKVDQNICSWAKNMPVLAGRLLYYLKERGKVKVSVLWPNNKLKSNAFWTQTWEDTSGEQHYGISFNTICITCVLSDAEKVSPLHLHYLGAIRKTTPKKIQKTKETAVKPH